VLYVYSAAIPTWKEAASLSQIIKTMLLIDGSNLWWGIKYYNQDHPPPILLDYEKLLKVLLANRYLVRAYYYHSHPIPIPPLQQKFLDYVHTSGFEMIGKPLKLRPGQRFVEKGVDVALATDLLGFAWENAFDVAVVVSGDSDLDGAIQKVRTKGRRVEVASFQRTLSPDLHKSDRLIVLDDIIDQIKK
jgi:uncharacterized LabA/DUF88 family protein